MHYGYVIEVIVKYCDNISKTEIYPSNDAYIYANIFFMNYMPMGIGRHYMIRRDITTKLYIVHYGSVEGIVKYGANT